MSSDAETLVRGFLAAIERRDEAAIQAALAVTPRITYPGGVTHAAAASMVAGSRARYVFVGKDIERVEVLAGDSGAAIAYVFGTLAGQFADGESFSGIRFIDRFEIENSLISRHDVWNDVAAYRAAQHS